MSLTLGAMQTGHAEEALTQGTISIYAGGKPVAGLLFPIGVRPTLSVVANNRENDGKAMHLTGNVQGRLTLPADQSIALFGEDIVLTREVISAERAKAMQDLEKMAASDQLYRGRDATGVSLTDDDWRRQTAIDVANANRLVQIIDTFGWPGLRFAGPASQTAFLVLQHADDATQRKYLPLLRQAVERHDALGSELAMLEDRLLVAEGKPQRYGTQLGGEPLHFQPIEDEANVDARRRSIGLPTMAEYAGLFGLTYLPVAARAEKAQQR
ncbi:hypothetical protein ASF61_00455 [Duganella sp. Leaf126]|uniref:DUF6624 domain-containing protein n=1 Tax=Duganella sp. Leaf126 TaxID=1736266 RepID=UPI0006F5F022|nr:DUF6624 domain-containing protein [Duganella sp. Leaf126]KQQ47163.1 hypothetical protein ASF61_00455 [Duganella sp. Leaf126]